MDLYVPTVRFVALELTILESNIVSYQAENNIRDQGISSTCN